MDERWFGRSVFNLHRLFPPGGVSWPERALRDAWQAEGLCHREVSGGVNTSCSATPEQTMVLEKSHTNTRYASQIVHGQHANVIFFSFFLFLWGVAGQGCFISRDKVLLTMQGYEAGFVIAYSIMNTLFLPRLSAFNPEYCENSRVPVGFLSFHSTDRPHRSRTSHAQL